MSVKKLRHSDEPQTNFVLIRDKEGKITADERDAVKLVVTKEEMRPSTTKEEIITIVRILKNEKKRGSNVTRTAKVMQ